MSTVKISIENNIAIIKINRPEQLNALSLKVLADPTNSEIPKNFELLYKSPYSGITAYKINHND